MRKIRSKKTWLFAIFTVFALGMISCSSDDKHNDDGKTEVEKGREAEIVNLYDNQIAPLQEEYSSAANTLFQKAQAFNTSTNNANLTDLKAAYKQTLLVWEENEIYYIGAIQNTFIYSGINKFPINPELIENNINGDSAINAGFVVNQSVYSKGYAAVEYLLFHTDEVNVLEEFTTGDNAQRRLDYLVALAQRLDEKAGELQEAWTIFAPDFKSSLVNGVDGSQNQLVNAMVQGFENIKSRRLNNALDNTDFTQLEAFRSGQSKAAIATIVESLKKTYTGNFQNGSGYGLKDYIIKVLKRQDLDEAIEQGFVFAQTALDTIPGTLKNAVVNHPEKVEIFRQKLTALIALFKTDLASAGQFVITFSDNDGD